MRAGCKPGLACHNLYSGEPRQFAFRFRNDKQRLIARNPAFGLGAPAGSRIRQELDAAVSLLKQGDAIIPKPCARPADRTEQPIVSAWNPIENLCP